MILGKILDSSAVLRPSYLARAWNGLCLLALWGLIKWAYGSSSEGLIFSAVPAIIFCILGFAASCLQNRIILLIVIIIHALSVMLILIALSAVHPTNWWVAFVLALVILIPVAGNLVLLSLSMTPAMITATRPAGIIPDAKAGPVLKAGDDDRAGKRERAIPHYHVSSINGKWIIDAAGAQEHGNLSLTFDMINHTITQKGDFETITMNFIILKQEPHFILLEIWHGAGQARDRVNRLEMEEGKLKLTHYTMTDRPLPPVYFERAQVN
jgi:hypothetical protein